MFLALQSVQTCNYYNLELIILLKMKYVNSHIKKSRTDGHAMPRQRKHDQKDENGADHYYLLPHLELRRLKVCSHILRIVLIGGIILGMKVLHTQSN